MMSLQFVKESFSDVDHFYYLLCKLAINDIFRKTKYLEKSGFQRIMRFRSQKDSKWVQCVPMILKNFYDIIRSRKSSEVRGLLPYFLASTYKQ